MCNGACECVLIDGQTAGPIGVKLGTRIHLDWGQFSFSKVEVSENIHRLLTLSQRRTRENGGAVGADLIRPEERITASRYYHTAHNICMHLYGAILCFIRYHGLVAS